MREDFGGMLCLLLYLLLLLNGNSALEKEKFRVRRQSQTTLTISEGVGEHGETYLSSEGIGRIVALTGFMAENRVIGSNQRVQYNALLDTVTVGDPGGFDFSGVKRLVTLTGSGLQEFTDQDFTIDNTEGRLYRDDCNAFFTGNRAIIDAIEGRRPYPPTDVEVMVTLRPDNSIQLNVDETPDGIANIEDDVVNLRGSIEKEVSVIEDIEYTGNTLTISRLGESTDTFDMIQEFHIIDETVRDGVEGLVAMSFEGSAPSRFSGPGTLFIGRNRDGGLTACYSTSPMLIDMVNRDIVDLQVSFSAFRQESAVEVATRGTLTTPSMPVIRITAENAQAEPYMHVSRMTYNDGTINIFDRNNRIIRSFSDQMYTMGSFFMNQIRFDSSGTAEYNLTDENIIVYVNMQDRSILAFPSSETALVAGITDATRNAGLVMAANVTYRRSRLGQGEFLVNGVVVLTDDNRRRTTSSFSTVALSFQSFMARTAGGTFERPALSAAAIRLASEMGRQFAAVVFVNETTTTEPGGGTLFTDNENRVLYVGPGAEQTANFIEMRSDLSPGLSVNVVRESVNGSQQLNLESAGNTLLEDLVNADKIDVGDEQRVVYSDNSASVANGIAVPFESQIFYNPDSNTIQVVRMGETIFTRSTNGQFFTRDVVRPDSTNMIVMVDSTGGNVTFEGGGVLYFGPSGATYLPFDTLDDMALSNLDQIGSLSSVAQNIGQLVTFEDGDIDSFSMNFIESFAGGGRLFVSKGRAFFTTDERLIREIPAQASQLLPISITTTENRNRVQVSRDGSDIYMFEAESMIRNTAEQDILEYAGGNLRAPTVFREPFVGVEMLTIFDGCSVVRMNSSVTNFTFGGEGLVIVDESAGTSFFTPDELSAERIRFSLGQLASVSIHPRVMSTFPSSITSKLRQVSAGFGQIVTTYQGASVDLECRAGNANPPATFSFFVSDENGTFSELGESESVMFVSSEDNVAILRLRNVSESGEYRCLASNAVGSDSLTARLNVRSRDDPSIVDNFFAGGALQYTLPVSVSSGSPRLVTPILEVSVPFLISVDPTFRAVNQTVIGCKADGKPKPTISWFRSVNGGPRMPVDLTRPEFEATSEDGQSVLSVALASSDTNCYQYICVADNGGTVAEGSAEICPIRYEVSIFMTGPVCSVTCGVGFREIAVTQLERFFNGSSTLLSASEIPPGLVQSGLTFCSLPPCPIITYEYETGEFTQCDAFCGGEGSQTREVSCLMVSSTTDGVRISNTSVDDEECVSRGIEKPSSRGRCNVRPCPIYRIGQLGPCSQTCRGGVRSREILCLMPVQNRRGRYTFVNAVAVDMDTCTNHSVQSPPDEVVPCNQERVCPVRYSATDYGECDEFFCQQRTVFCANFDHGNPREVWPTDDAVCLAQGLTPPHTVRSCNGGICAFGQWEILRTRNCSVSCGFGTAQRDVVCTNSSSGEVIENGFCSSLTRPDTQARCIIRNCPGIYNVLNKVAIGIGIILM